MDGNNIQQYFHCYIIHMRALFLTTFSDLSLNHWLTHGMIQVK